MRTRLLTLASVALTATLGFSFYSMGDSPSVTDAASAFLGSLDEDQRKVALLPYETPQRLDWHFVPKSHRKGLQIRDMNDEQVAAAHRLLRSALSEAGYGKATAIMELEKLLKELEQGRGSNIRDPLRYFVTLFGEPQADGKWGLSFEGHHLSLNFVVDHGRVIASTPQVFAANPAIVKSANSVGIAEGTRVLAREETLAFELVNSLSEDQQAVAVVAEKAPREVRSPGSPQPPLTPAQGIAYRDLDEPQRQLLMQLLMEYCSAMPEKVAQERLDRLHFDGLNEIHFAWAGAREPGIGHSYIVQSPAFLIEFVNVQPDAAGNPANHIHCLWRNRTGDFAEPLEP